MKQFDTYIFDLDGTLLYTLDDLTASTNHAINIKRTKAVQNPVLLRYHSPLKLKRIELSGVLNGMFKSSPLVRIALPLKAPQTAMKTGN